MTQLILTLAKLFPLSGHTGHNVIHRHSKLSDGMEKYQ
jgi:hypothetical protein